MRRNVNRKVFNDRKNLSATIVGSAYVYPLDTRMRRNVNRKGFNDRKNVSATAPQQYCDVTTIRQTRHLRSSRHQISRWRRRCSKQTGGGLFLPSFPSFFQCFTCASLFRNKVHSQDYSCIMVQRPVRHSGTFCLCKMQDKVRCV